MIPADHDMLLAFAHYVRDILGDYSDQYDDAGCEYIETYDHTSVSPQIIMGSCHGPPTKIMWKRTVDEFLHTAGITMKQLHKPLRMALTGSHIGLDIIDIMDIMGVDMVCSRIVDALTRTYAQARERSSGGGMVGCQVDGERSSEI